MHFRFTAGMFRCAVIGLAMLVAQAARATQTIWVADSNDILGTVDSATGTPTMIGAIGTQLTDIAFDPAGNLWGVGGPGFQWLYTVNKVTGAATAVGDMGTPVNSLVFSPGGTLYGAYASLFTINTTTAAATAIGSGLGYQAAGDLAFNGGTLYVSANDPGGFGSDVLVDVNTATGAGSVVGAIGVTGVFGMAGGSDGVLYGGVGNHIITINTTTGAGSPLSSWLIFNGSFGGVDGADIAPVPEPSAIGLLLIGLGWLVSRREEKGSTGASADK